MGDEERYLDPAWLADVLDAPVAAVDATPVGTGQVAASLRLTLTYDGPTALPPTLVAKVPSSDPVSRATGVLLRNYEIETSFYRDLAAGLPMRTPGCFHVEHDPETHDFVLLLEDLAPAEQGDQLAGCSDGVAAVAVEELAKLHGPRWNDPSLSRLAWLDRATPERAEQTAGLLAMLHPGFVERYADVLDADIVALLERIVPRLGAYTAERDGPRTIQHGDYRLDNLLFGTDAGGPPIAVVDWQTVVLGDGVVDLSYFVGAAMETDARRACERELVAWYRQAMASFGVELDPDDLWLRYRRYTIAGLLMALGASMVVGRTERGDEMFMAMAHRHGRHALDLDAEAVLDPTAS